MRDKESFASTEHRFSAYEGKEFYRFWCCCWNAEKSEEFIRQTERNYGHSSDASSLSLEEVSVGAAVVIGSVAAGAVIVATVPVEAVACIAIVAFVGVLSIFN